MTLFDILESMLVFFVIMVRDLKCANASGLHIYVRSVNCCNMLVVAEQVT